MVMSPIRPKPKLIYLFKPIWKCCGNRLEIKTWKMNAARAADSPRYFVWLLTRRELGARVARSWASTRKSINQSDPLRGRGVPPISNKKQILCFKICFILKQIIKHILNNKIFCYIICFFCTFCYIICFLAKKQILQQNICFFKMRLKNKLFCFIICFLQEGGPSPLFLRPSSGYSSILPLKKPQICGFLSLAGSDWLTLWRSVGR